MKPTNIIMLILSLVLLSVLATTTLADTWFESPTPANGYASELNLLEINASINCDNCREIKFIWNGTNVSPYINQTRDDLFDGLILDLDFENNAAIGENETHVTDNSQLNWMNGTATYDLSWNPSGGLFGSGAYNFTGENFSAERPNLISLTGMGSPIKNNTANYTISIWFQQFNSSYITSGAMSDYTVYILFGDYSGWLKGTNTGISYRVFNISDGATGNEFEHSPGTYTYSNAGAGEWHSYIVTTETQNGVDITQDKRNISFFVDGNFHSSTLVYGDLKYHTNDRANLGGHLGYPQLQYLAMNGSLDEFMVLNRTWSADDINAYYGSANQKINESLWTFEANKTNLTSGDYTYQVCSMDNVGNENCTDEQIYRVLPQGINLSVNYSETKGQIAEHFYGANTHGQWLSGNASETTSWIKMSGDTINSPSDTAWNRNTWMEAGLGYQRIDMNLGIYLTLPNAGFEQWIEVGGENNTYLDVDSDNIGNQDNYPFGWTLLDNDVGNGTFMRWDADAKSGVYSFNITNNASASDYILIRYVLPFYAFNEGDNVTITYWAKSSYSNTLFKSKFVNYDSQQNICKISNYPTWSDSSWQQYYCENSSMNVDDEYSEKDESAWEFALVILGSSDGLIDDVNISVNGGTWKVWKQMNASTNNINMYKTLMEWAHDNDQKVLSIASYTPLAMSNLSSGHCGLSNYTRCEPTDNQEFANAVVEWIKETTNDGAYADALEIEVWNEPDLPSFWLGYLDNTDPRRGEIYNNMYNATCTSVRKAYPTIPCFGMGLARSTNGNSEMLKYYLSNHSPSELGMLSNGVISTHVYGSSSLNTDLTTEIKYVLDNCSYYNVNCSRIMINEWNNNDANTKTNETYPTLFTYTYSKALATVLDTYVQNISQMITFQWAESTVYNNTASYSEYPQRWAMTSEPNLDGGLNDGRSGYYPSYNVTKAFAHLCPSGASVVNYTTSDDSAVSVLACKKDNMYALVLINPLGTDVNYTNVNLSEDNVGLSIPSLRDYETSDVYTLTDNVLDGIVLTPQEVKFLLSSTNTPSTSLTSPTDGQDKGLLFIPSTEYTQSDCSLTFNCITPAFCTGDTVNITTTYARTNITEKAGMTAGTKTLINITILFFVLGCVIIFYVMIKKQIPDI